MKNIGKRDEVREVPDGYARNFLIPNGLAKQASASALNALGTKKADEAAHKRLAKQKAEAAAQKLSGKTFVFRLKTGDKGELFGSVSSRNIEEKILKEEHETIAATLPKHIKELGENKVRVNCGEGAETEVTIRIVAD